MALRKKTIKRGLGVGACAGLIAAILLWPGLPWSGRVHHALNRAALKTEIKLAEWRGANPRPVSLSGKIVGTGAHIEALKGARISAPESISQYCAMSDGEGRFLLPHLMWYPGATYSLIVAPDVYRTRHLKVSAPRAYPEEGVIDVGELSFDAGREVEDKDPAVRPLAYDIANAQFYRDLFDQLTASAETDEQKIDAIGEYVATKLNHQETSRSFKSARGVLERGSGYCVNLALAMAAITASGNYPTRIVHTSDSPQYLYTHAVVEVYYGDRWHVYDPTYGVTFLNEQGVVASYKDLRLNAGLITPEAFRHVDLETTQRVLEWMPGTYGSGIHQIYHVDR